MKKADMIEVVKRTASESLDNVKFENAIDFEAMATKIYKLLGVEHPNSEQYYQLTDMLWNYKQDWGTIKVANAIGDLKTALEIE